MLAAERVLVAHRGGRAAVLRAASPHVLVLRDGRVHLELGDAVGSARRAAGLGHVKDVVLVEVGGGPGVVFIAEDDLPVGGGAHDVGPVGKGYIVAAAMVGGGVGRVAEVVDRLTGGE